MSMQVVLLKLTTCPACVEFTRVRGAWKYIKERPENEDLKFSEYYMDEGDPPAHIKKADPEVGYPEVICLDDNGRRITSVSGEFGKNADPTRARVEATIQRARAKYAKKGA